VIKNQIKKRKDNKTLSKKQKRELYILQH
jgi:hypothetical protein